MAFSFSEFWRKEGSATANKTGGQKWEGGRRNSWSEAVSSSAHPDPHRGSAQGESRRQKRSKNLWNFPAEPQINISTRSRAGGQLLGWRWACCWGKDTDSRIQRFVRGPRREQQEGKCLPNRWDAFFLLKHLGLIWEVGNRTVSRPRPDWVKSTNTLSWAKWKLLNWSCRDCCFSSITVHSSLWNDE